MDQLFGSIGGGQIVRGGRESFFLEKNCLFIAIEISPAPGAHGQVLLELDEFLGRQAAEQVFVQELGEFTGSSCVAPPIIGVE